MKYKIYKLVNPNQFLINNLYVLQEMDYSSKLDGEYNSPEEALNAIKNNIEEAKFKTLTILPVITVNYNGEIN